MGGVHTAELYSSADTQVTAAPERTAETTACFAVAVAYQPRRMTVIAPRRRRAAISCGSTPSRTR
nr:hypothetical protein [Tsukamurella sputi]